MPQVICYVLYFNLYGRYIGRIAIECIWCSCVSGPLSVLLNLYLNVYISNISQMFYFAAIKGKYCLGALRFIKSAGFKSRNAEWIVEL